VAFVYRRLTHSPLAPNTALSAVNPSTTARDRIGAADPLSRYAVEVSHRGEQTFSFNELEGEDWDVALVLG
jgi:hypothetical protein